SWNLRRFVQERLPQLHEADCRILELRLPVAPGNGAVHPGADDLLVVIENRQSADEPQDVVSQHREVVGRIRLQEIRQVLLEEAGRIAAKFQSTDLASQLKELSDREWEVLFGLLRGQSCKQIAASLGIGFPTVAKHRGHIFRKLRIASVAELTN